MKLRGPKVRALLADLLMQRGQVVSADRLIEDLWGSRLPGRPKASLQVRVSQLRSALDRAEPDGRRLLVGVPPGYRLDVRAGDLDAERFAALIDRARATEDLRAQATVLSEALALWRGPALADLRDEPFAVATVNRLEEDRLLALEDLAETRLSLGEHHALVGELAELVAAQPFRERLRAVHLRALYAAGRQREALESYDELRDGLREELGLDPGPELVAVRQAILLQDPALEPAPTPAPLPVAAPVPRRTNLPVPATALVGRSEAVDAVRPAVAAARLVTLTGSGGVGKTRLALEAASQLVGDFPDGVWLVELSTFDGTPHAGDRVTAGDVARLVMDVLGIRDDSRLAPTARSATDRLAEVLYDKRLLLVLDNCEHVIDAAAEVVLGLLRGTRQPHVLATSHEPLRVAGERLWTVPPLELPDRAETDPAALQRSPAVQLFVARAAASTGFALDRTNAPAVAAICWRLDGVPLALELAATRVRGLGVDALAARLDDRFRLLAGGSRGAPARQQTLRAMLDWSWDLLTHPERQVLSRLASQVDGCTLDAAEAVCSGGDIKPRDVLDLVSALVDKSLVVVVAGGDGTARYRLPESVAAYGTERLRASGEEPAVRQRHRAFYVGVAEEAEPHLRHRSQHAWLARLDTEAANLRSAIEGAAASGDAEQALRLVNALGWYWFLRGRLGDGHHLLGVARDIDGAAPAGVREQAAAWQVAFALLCGEPDDPRGRVEAALTPLAQVPDPVRRARAEWFLGDSLLRLGDLSAASPIVDRARATFLRHDDRWGRAAALASLSELALFRGDLDAVARDGRESADIFADLGDSWGQLRATGILADRAEVTGDYGLATRLQRACLNIAEEAALRSTDVSYRMSGLGRLAVLVRDYALADEYHLRARELARLQGDRAAEQFAELGLALGARRQGRLDEAEAYLRKWLDANRRVDGHAGLPLILAELGFIAELRGDARRARELHLESCQAAHAANDPRAVALALEGLAGAYALSGNHDRAAQLLAAAGTTREALGAPLPQAERGDVERITAASRAALGDEAFTRTLRAGPMVLQDLGDDLGCRLESFC